MKHNTKFVTRHSIVGMIGVVLAIILALTLTPSVFAATEYDIRGAGNVTINGAIFEEYTLAGSTGTGVFHPFLQVNGVGGHPKSPVYGFSTDLPLAPTTDFCESGAPGIFYTTEPTYQVLLTELPKVTHNGTLYVEFMLDSNQAKNDDSRQLSWDQLKVYQTNTTAITYPQLSALTPIWDLDSGTDRWIHFDAQFGSGSGQGDMRILIPASLFSSSYQYVIAWVSFGGSPDTDPCADGIESAHPNDDGFEEFGYVEKPVGCLEITKSLSIPGGVSLGPLDGTFVINVANAAAGFSQNVTFTMTDGVITSTNPVTLSGLTPGTYTLTEPGVPAYWTPSGLGDVTVSAGSTCAARTVTNTYVPGCLTITKNLTIPVGVPLGPLDGTFIINVAGPYGFSQNVSFTMVDGVITSTNPVTLNNLIPGTYALAEPGIPAGWSNVGGLGVVTVNSGVSCAARTVTNTYVPGCLEITKSLSIPGGVPLGPLDGTFIINVAGPYGFSQNVSFTMVNGVITSTNPVTLNNLIPGNYTLTEPGIPSHWTPSNLGTVVVSSGVICASRTVTNTYVPGCLEITKSLSIPGGVPLGPLDGTFIINVAGPFGFSQNVSFTMVNGVITSANPVTLNNLIPGNYTLTEPGIPAYWTPSGLGDVVVSSGVSCATKTVTNTYVPGCLEITKSLSIPGGVPLGPLDGTFIINVANAAVGFSQNVTFTMVNGVITSTNPVTLNNLIPGTYTLTEPGVPAYWTPSGLGDVVVSSGVSCATKTVTNTYVPGCLEVTKAIDWGDIIGDPADVPDIDFTVTVTGPSYPSGHNLTFHLINGEVTYDGEADDTACLCNLIPGDYYVTEIAPAGWEDAVITGSPATVEAGDTCGGVAIASAPFGMTNPGFESGDFTGWTVDEGSLGNASVETSFDAYYWDGNSTEYYSTYYAYCGDYFAVLEAGNVTENTSVSQDFSINAGETIEGWAFFNTQEAAEQGEGDFNDECSVDIMDGATLVERVFFSDTWDPNWPATPWTYWSWTANSSGTYTLLARVVNIGDSDVPSFIGLDICEEAADGAPVVTVTNEPTPGCLEVRKAIDWGDIIGSHADVPDVDFTVTVTGPSYPSGHNLTFHLVDGVVTYDDDDTACLCDLIPGNYTAGEVAPAGWEDAVITGSPAVVEAGDECDDGAALITVTNEPTPGCLEVKKAIDWGDIIGSHADVPDVDFIVTITGPSYPGGHNLTFHLVDGVATYDDDDTACLCDLIPGNYTASEVAPAGWEDAVITGSPAVVEAGDECDDGAALITVTNEPTPGCLEVRKVVDLDDYMFAGSANSTFTITVTGPSYPTGHNLTFDLINGVVQYGLDAGGDTACLCNLIPGNYTAAETPPAGWGAANITGSPAAVEAGVECDDGAPVITVTNTLLIPHTTISIEADVYETTPGGNVWLYISDTNDGYVPLTDPSVHLFIGGVEFDANNVTPGVQPLTKGDAYWSVGPPTWAISSGTANGDAGNDGIMGVGETWCWAVQVTISADTDFIVNGHGIDPLGNPVDGPTYIDETDTIRVEVGGATRTWGFWKTHLFLVNWMFNPAGGNITLPIYMGTWRNYSGTLQAQNITNVCRYMGLMWSDQSKNSDRTPRYAIDVVRIHAAHQALAAIMNSLMPGGAPLPGGLTPASIATTLSSDNITAIRNLGSVLGDYNESGDLVPLDPSLQAHQGNANPRGARAAGAACMSYWNTPPKPR